MKETYYFRHDYNSRNDEKILKLRQKYGAEGYGLYWMIIEKISESSEGRIKLSDIDAISYDIHSDSKRIASVIQDFDLFKIDKDYFFSLRLLSDLEERNKKSEKAILANKIRWDNERRKNKRDYWLKKAKKNPNGFQGKERKGEERKEEEKKKNIKEKMNKKDFEIFWKNFPNKKGKKNCQKKFLSLDQELLPIILQSIDAHKKTYNWQHNQYIPHASTWINQERWNDELSPSDFSPPPNQWGGVTVI